MGETERIQNINTVRLDEYVRDGKEAVLMGFVAESIILLEGVGRVYYLFGHG